MALRVIVVSVILCLLTAGDDHTPLVAQATETTEQALTVLRRWNNEVWHAGKLELVPELVGPTYVRHEAAGTRTVTPEQYAQEIAARRKQVPDIRFTEHDRVVKDNFYWTRWSMRGTDARTGKVVTRAGIQIYRLDRGRLVETWVAALPEGSGWTK